MRLSDSKSRFLFKYLVHSVYCERIDAVTSFANALEAFVLRAPTREFAELAPPPRIKHGSTHRTFVTVLV